MKKLYTFFVFLFLSQFVKSQIPTPQDCPGAVTICQDVYEEADPYPYQNNNGNYLNEIQRPVGKDCYTKEDNGVWYVFTVQTTGNLRFNLQPHDLDDDYDWILFDLTSGSCAELSENSETYMVSSNNYGHEEGDPVFDGNTGANSALSGGAADNCNGPGKTNGPAFNDDIPVSAGRTYYLYLSNFSNSLNGYRLDFSSSTADIIDDVPPYPAGITNEVVCDPAKIKLRFNERVRCSDINTAGFTLSGPDGNYPISNAYGEYCQYGGTFDRDFNIQISQKLKPGNYILNLSALAKDACNNTSPPTSINFKIGPEIQSVNPQFNGCYGEQKGKIEVTASDLNSLTYSIDNGANFQESNVFENLPVGTYKILVKNTGKCIAEYEPVIITSPSGFVLESKDFSQSLKCFGDQNGYINFIVQGGTGALQYSIDGQNYFPSGNFQNLAAKEYTLHAKDEQNCKSDFGIVPISEPEKLEFDLFDLSNITDCSGANNSGLTVSTKGGSGEILYSMDNQNFNNNGTFSNLTEGYYQIYIKDENDCSNSKEFEIFADYRSCLIIPGSFTPNGDGINEKWQIGYIHLFPDAQVKIFDRWGKLVATYQANQEMWNGYIQGNLPALDCYYYALILNKRFDPIKGTVTVIK